MRRRKRVVMPVGHVRCPVDSRRIVVPVGIPTPDPEDDPRTRCLRESLAYIDGYPDLANRAVRSIDLLRGALATAPTLVDGTIFANVVAAEACFTRAYQDLQAALDLAIRGHYTSLGPTLRAAYEAGLLGRHLAKEPALAESWLKQGSWVPPGGTRQWMRETEFLGLSDADQATYADQYRFLSALSHATAQACLPALKIADGEVLPRLEVELDRDTLDKALALITSTALFCCFAWRNAAAHPMHIDPTWLEPLSQLAEEVSGAPMPHLHRDWPEEQRRFANLMQLVRDVEELDDFLTSSPLSSRNLQARLAAQPVQSASDSHRQTENRDR